MAKKNRNPGDTSNELPVITTAVLVPEEWLIAAIPDFKDALRLQPDYPAAHCNQGDSCLAQNRSKEAVGEFITVLKAHPDS